MNRLVFHPDARAEYFAAIDYYNDASAKLADAFVRDVEAAIDLILSYPSAWPSFRDNIRRCMLGRFPYFVVYAHEDGDILILAVAHAKRTPGYWLVRKT